ALAMFRDEPLSEFRFEEFALREAHRLRELRLATLEEQIDAELELGRELELIPLLESVVADEPYRERPRAQLMLALYRSGRQAEALHVYRDGRRALVEDLGLEPGEALQRLERQILNQAPELAARGVLALGPRRAAAVRPEGIVTMLYADGAARAPTRAVVSQAGGFEVEARGDAVVAAFARARDAVAAAVALERSSRHEMRVGVHSGEAVSTSDVSADPVARGAWSIACAAHPGQILLSQAARDLLRETPLAEVDVRDLGEHRLLDLGPPRRVFQLVARELPSEFPPPRSLDTYVTNLPPQPTPLVGRGHMIREIVETLRRPDVR